MVPIDQEPSRRRKVVVIDDDLCMRELLTLHLRNAGYEVFAAEDAVAGGHAILRETPDVIICDVEMPYLNGYEFVAALKTHGNYQKYPGRFSDLPRRCRRVRRQPRRSRLSAQAADV